MTICAVEAVDDASSDRDDASVSASSPGAVRAKDAKWQAVYLICKQCKDRSSGPKHLKPKDLAKEVRDQTRRASVRSRIVMTRCLGLCPKNAAAMACAGSAGVRLVAVKAKDDVPAALAALCAPRTVDPDTTRVAPLEA